MVNTGFYIVGSFICYLFSDYWVREVASGNGNGVRSGSGVIKARLKQGWSESGWMIDRPNMSGSLCVDKVLLSSLC